ncbi:MAG: transcriptional regulator [Firmicutes bacterium]|nr:transcriptional regulator [Bacillota bacterium]
MYTDLCTTEDRGDRVEQFARIGEKVIDRDRLYHVVDRILELRAAGVSQQEVAERLGTERSFISRLETLGEIHRGERLALVGFPIANKDELLSLAQEEGIEYTLILTDEERWRFVREKSGNELLNEVMQIIADVKTYDTVIFLGSDMRVRVVEALLDKKVVCIEIGRSPIKRDCEIDANKLRRLIRKIKACG